jgi:hypothetical protein
MRLVLLALAAVGAWLVLRRRRADEHRVVVAWEDGSEVELRAGTPEREQLTSIAGEVLR